MGMGCSIRVGDGAAVGLPGPGEVRFFKLSLLYLFAHFGAILVEAGLSRFGLGGW